MYTLEAPPSALGEGIGVLLGSNQPPIPPPLGLSAPLQY